LLLLPTANFTRFNINFYYDFLSQGACQRPALQPPRSERSERSGRLKAHVSLPSLVEKTSSYKIILSKAQCKPSLENR